MTQIFDDRDGPNNSVDKPRDDDLSTSKQPSEQKITDASLTNPNSKVTSNTDPKEASDENLRMPASVQKQLWTTLFCVLLTSRKLVLQFWN